MKKIRLWKNKHELSDRYAIVDAEDYDMVIEAVTTINPSGSKRKNTGKWYIHDTNAYKGYHEIPYAVAKSRKMSIHRLVMNPPDDMYVDHINGDTLDNRKKNLRICTPRENRTNSRPRRDSLTGLKGVHILSEHRLGTGFRSAPFRAQIAHPDRRSTKMHIGYYATTEEAAEAWDVKAVEFYGEFANLNYPEKKGQYLEEINRSK